MKKNIVISMLLTAGVILSGCSENKESAEGNAATNTVPQTEYVMQDGDVQIVGEVTQIIGNEVTLDLGDVSESTSKGERNDNKPPSMSDNDNELPQMGEDGEFPQTGESGEAPQMPNGGDFPQTPDGSGEFQQRGGDRQSGGQGRQNRQQGVGKSSSVSIEKSGETNSYIIPVGMTVSGASGRNNDYSAVSAGMILRLTLNSEGYVVAAEIL